MKRSLNISGLEHLIKILNTYPQMLSLSSFNPVREVAKKAQQAVQKTRCNCSAAPVYSANRMVFERALDAMGHGDHLIVKSILNVDELCYYAKDAKGTRILKCV